MDIEIPEDGYMYGIILGGRKHGKLMVIPENANQIFIRFLNKNAIYWREKRIDPEPFEKSNGEIYTKYENEFLTKDNHRIGIWYLGFGHRSEELAGQALSLMKDDWELKHIFGALLMEGKYDAVAH